MVEIDKPWIRKPDQQWAPSNPEPRELFSPKNINKSLEDMHAEAVEMGLDKGVAFLATWPFISTIPRVAFTVVGSLERDPDPDKEGDIGTNYFGIAMSKLAYMLSTREDSGSQARPIKFGEVSYKGGLIVTTQEGSGIYIGYSGGTEDQDVQIANKGFSTLIQLVEEKE